MLNSVEAQVRLRTAELEKANQEKADFMSFLCHELRNPLHVVASMTDLELTDDPNSVYAKAVSTASSKLLYCLVRVTLSLTKNVNQLKST